MTCNADTVSNCLANSTIVECESNESSCEITLRKRRGETYFVQSGCKALDACLNNAKQNARGPWKWQACKPFNNPKVVNSVCRQCCDGGADCVERHFFNSDKSDGSANRDNWLGDFVGQDD